MSCEKLTYSEKKTIERALEILEAHDDERAKRFAVENDVKIDLHKMVFYAAYYQGALMAARSMVSYALQNYKGEDIVYRDAELALITQSKRTMELFMDGTQIRYRNHERDKKGRLTKCEAYFYKEHRIIQEVT
jgi:hypothetical protein